MERGNLAPGHLITRHSFIAEHTTSSSLLFTSSQSPYHILSISEFYQIKTDNYNIQFWLLTCTVGISRILNKLSWSLVTSIQQNSTQFLRVRVLRWQAESTKYPPSPGTKHAWLSCPPQSRPLASPPVPPRQRTGDHNLPSSHGSIVKIRILGDILGKIRIYMF